EGLGGEVAPAAPAPVVMSEEMQAMRQALAAAPAAPSVETDASADLDSSGLPWDERIHASNRAKITNGTWRKKPGVDKDVAAQIEAELRAQYPAAPAAPRGPAAPAAPAAPAE